MTYKAKFFKEDFRGLLGVGSFFKTYPSGIIWFRVNSEIKILYFDNQTQDQSSILIFVAMGGYHNSYAPFKSPVLPGG